MKLKIAAAAAALAAFGSVSAFADGITIDYDFNDKKMIISGEADNQANSYASITLINSDNGKPYLIDQTITDSKGKCSFEIGIDLLDNGTYQANVHIGSEEYNAQKYFNTSLIPKDTQSGGGSGGSSGSSGGSGGGTSSGGVTYAPVVSIPDMSVYNNSAAADFDDVPDTHWAYKSVSSLYAKGIVSGLGDNRFGPDERITREQFAKMLIDTMKLDLVDDDIDHIDADKNSWSYTYLVAVYKYGIMEGYSDEVLGAKDNILRQDLAALVNRALEVKSLTLNSGEKPPLPDYEEISEYARDSVQKLYAAGIISGMEDGSFMPKEYVTRAQAAVILDKLLSAIGG